MVTAKTTTVQSISLGKGEEAIMNNYIKVSEGKGCQTRQKRKRSLYKSRGRAKGTPKKQPSAENPDMFGRRNIGKDVRNNRQTV